MLDLNKIKANYLMDDEIVANLIDIFQESARRDLLLLEKAIANKNSTDTHKIAHKLKSGFAYLFQPQISSKFEEIQKLSINDENFITINKIFDSCKSECSQLFSYISN